MTTTVSIRNWSEYQHYKDRSAPWIKLHRDILTSDTWVLGTDLTRLLQVASTLLAVRYDNATPLNFTLWRKVLSLDCTESEFDAAIEHLIERKFFSVQEDKSARKQDASKLLAKCSSEERREEGEGEGEKTQNARAKTRVPITNAHHHETATAIRAIYPARAGRTDWITAEHHIRIRLDEGYTQAELVDAVSRFAAYSDAAGQTGTKYVMTPANFFGAADKPWTQPWTIPTPGAKPNGSKPTFADYDQHLDGLIRDAEILEGHGPPVRQALGRELRAGAEPALVSGDGFPDA